MKFCDFNAISYDQQTGRFLQVDPLFEQNQESFTPYHFTFNNPIRYNDPDGEAPEDIIVTGANNSSITIKTELIDVKVGARSLGIDFGGEFTLEGDDIYKLGWILWVFLIQVELLMGFILVSRQKRELG